MLLDFLNRFHLLHSEPPVHLKDSVLRLRHSDFHCHHLPLQLLGLAGKMMLDLIQMFLDLIKMLLCGVHLLNLPLQLLGLAGNMMLDLIQMFLCGVHLPNRCLPHLRYFHFSVWICLILACLYCFLFLQCCRCLVSIFQMPFFLLDWCLLILPLFINPLFPFNFVVVLIVCVFTFRISLLNI